MALSIGCVVCAEAQLGLKTKGSNKPPKIRCATCDAGMPWDEKRERKDRNGRVQQPLSGPTGFREIPIAYTNRYYR